MISTQREEKTEDATPSKPPAIAVLPFANMSGDPEQEYFADGITEDIITNLSLWRTFPVISRNSSFAYRGKSLNLKQVADELGARYIVEGSVRKGGNRVRITAQLIDAERRLRLRDTSRIGSPASVRKTSVHGKNTYKA